MSHPYNDQAIEYIHDQLMERGYSLDEADEATAWIFNNLEDEITVNNQIDRLIKAYEEEIRDENY